MRRRWTNVKPARARRRIARTRCDRPLFPGRCRRRNYLTLRNYMNLRGGRRGSRTWLAIQASTKASTSGDLRILAHSAAERSRAPSRTMMGELLITATSARRLPEDESRPINALQNPMPRPPATAYLEGNARRRGQFLPLGNSREGLPCGSNRFCSILSPQSRCADGSEGAKLSKGPR